MKRFVMSFFVLFAVAIAVADAIKCYVCVGTGNTCTENELKADKAKFIMTCQEPLDTCMRTWTKKDDKISIYNSCTNKTQCDAAKKSWACDDVTDRQCNVSCCYTDACNAGLPGSPTVSIKCTNGASKSVSFGVFLMIVCSVLQAWH